MVFNLQPLGKTVQRHGRLDKMIDQKINNDAA
jgi:hypothetical protein